jgi:flagellar hook assembly protein FlgD
MNRKKFFKLGIAGMGTIALTTKLKALEYYPMASSKKWAVIYSTWCGSSRDAAVWISEGMGGIANVFDIREIPDLSGFDHIVIGGSIRSMATSAEMQNYITSNKETLKVKVRGLFAVCGNMGNPVGPAQTTSFIDNHLAQLCGVSGLPSKVFLGRITKSLMDASTAASMAGATDYDNLKRADCMALGKEILNNTTTVKKAGSSTPQKFELGQNHPEPFSKATTIAYNLPESANVLLAIYTVTGQKVATLVSAYQEAGQYKVTWDGSGYAAGSYLYRLEAGNFAETHEALLIR